MADFLAHVSLPKRRATGGVSNAQNWLSSAVVVVLLAIAVFFLQSQTTVQAHQMSDLEKALLTLSEGISFGILNAPVCTPIPYLENCSRVKLLE